MWKPSVVGGHNLHILFFLKEFSFPFNSKKM